MVYGPGTSFNVSVEFKKWKGHRGWLDVDAILDSEFVKALSLPSGQYPDS